MNNTAKDLVLPAPKTPAMHRSDIPVMIASRSAMARIVQKKHARIGERVFVAEDTFAPAKGYKHIGSVSPKKTGGHVWIRHLRCSRCGLFTKPVIRATPKNSPATEY